MVSYKSWPAGLLGNILVKKETCIFSKRNDVILQNN